MHTHTHTHTQIQFYLLKVITVNRYIHVQVKRNKTGKRYIYQLEI